MKNIFCTIAAIPCLLFSARSLAQDSDTTAKKKKHHAITISNRGFSIKTIDSTTPNSQVGKIKDTVEEKSRFNISYAMVDLGVNIISDNTNYADPAVKTFLNVPANRQNKSLFDLRTGKSINVNIYPVMVKFTALKAKKQRIYISTGLGLQLYNFRYESPLTYTKNPSSVTLDTITFKKDKLALDYLNVPLMFTFKTKLHKDTWLTYGVGITEGYLIASWTKQESGQRGKVKLRDAFGLANTNTCLSAEFGVEGIFRFFASYQLTSLYQNGLDQHPISFGLRFGGI